MDERRETGPPKEEDDDLESLETVDSRELVAPDTGPEPPADESELAALAASADAVNERLVDQLADEDATLDLRSIAETISDAPGQAAPAADASPATPTVPGQAAQEKREVSPATDGASVDPAPQKSRRLLRALLLPTGFALGLTAGALLFVGRGNQTDPEPEDAPSTTETASTVERPTPPEAKPNRSEEPADESAEAMAEPPAATPDEKRPAIARAQTARSARPKRPEPEPGTAPPRQANATEGGTPAGDAPVKSKNPSDMDRFLDDALQSPAARRAKQKSTGAERSPAESDLPLVPSREQVTEAVVVLLPAIRGCAMGRQGTALVSIVVRNNGRVARAQVGGAFAGTSIGRCIEGVVRKARFPEFRQSTFRIQYPIAIRGGSRGAG